MTAEQAMTPAKQAAAEINAMFDHPGVMPGGLCDDELRKVEATISRAILQEVAPLQAVIDARGKEITRLLSAQRPYVEWIMKATHHDYCGYPFTGDHCSCGLFELRKQVGVTYDDTAI